MNFLLRIALIPLFLTTLLLPQTLSETEQLEAWLTVFKQHRGDVLFPAAYSSLQNRIDSLKQRPKPGATNGESGAPEAYFFLSKELLEWIDTAQYTSEMLNPLLSLRARVATMGAEDYASSLFFAADKKLQQAAKAYRNDKSNHARQLAAEARELYQKAEFACIRNNLLGEMRILIQESLNKQADKLAPQTLRKVQALLADVESMVKSQRYYSETLSQKTQELMREANHLYQLVQTLQPIYQSPDAGEAFLLKMEREFKLLAEQVEDSAMRRAVGFQNLLNALKDKLAELSSENRRLLSRNQLLESEKQDLEKALLRFQYGNFDVQQSLLGQKIERVRRLMGEDRVEEQGSFLVIYLDSLDQLFDTDSQLKPINNEKRLTVLTEALSEFAENPIYLRYIKYSYDNLAFTNTIATQRVESLKTHIRSYPAFQENSQLFTAAFVYEPEQPQDLDRDYLEIRIDLKAYLSARDKHGATTPQHRKSSTE